MSQEIWTLPSWEHDIFLLETQSQDLEHKDYVLYFCIPNTQLSPDTQSIPNKGLLNEWLDQAETRGREINEKTISTP